MVFQNGPTFGRKNLTCSFPVGKNRPLTTTKLFSVRRSVVTLSFVTCDRSRNMCVLESSKKKRPSSSWEMNPSTYFDPLLPTSDCNGVDCKDGERKHSQLNRRRGTQRANFGEDQLRSDSFSSVKSTFDNCAGKASKKGSENAARKPPSLPWQTRLLPSQQVED
jgi:hypothetical protein